MQVIINGRPENLGNLETLGDWLRSREVMPRRVAVELNGDLLPRERYDETRLVEGDRLEIVTLVGGG